MHRPFETINLILDSRLENVDPMEKAALDVAQRAGFHGIDLEKIGIAVHEIVTNAILHGNRLDSGKQVVVTILRTAEQLEFVVRDQGKGFDPHGLPNPRSPEALLTPSGRGIYLARAFMDEFIVQAESSNGATVKLIKYIRRNRRLRIS